MTGKSSERGSCLCGAVSVQGSQISHSVDACHCSMCRKWGGGPLLAVDGGSDIQFKGTENITVFESSEWAERGFCSKCGSHLFYKLKQQNQTIVPIGLFDNIDELNFEKQIFVDEKPEYYCFSNETINMSSEEVFALFAPKE